MKWPIVITICLWAVHCSDNLNPQGFTPKNYTIKKCLVTREYVSVMLGRPVTGNQPAPDCIIKILDKRKLLLKHGRVQRAEFEALSLSTIQNHDHVVRLYHTMQDQFYGYLVTEFLDAVTLESYCERVQLDESKIRFIVGELVLAVESVHDVGFIHRDVKPDNIMLTRRGHLKLIDFGFAVPIGQHESVVRSGTPLYAACEYLEHRPYNQSLDWYAVGMVTLQMVNRMGLIHKLTGQEISAAKSCGKLPDIIEPVSNDHRDCVDFLKLILGDCEHRPCDGAALKRHAWLSNAQFGLSSTSPLDMSTVPSTQTRNAIADNELMEDYPMFHYDVPTRGVLIPTNRLSSQPISTVQLRYY